jgi:NADH-quinone oxidoreductase subunit M
MLNGFIGEFLVLSSTFTGASRSWAIVATLGVIFSAAYMLTLIQKVFYGPPSGAVTANPQPNAALDLGFNEKLVTFSLAVIMLVMGVFPNIFLYGIETSTSPLMKLSARSLVKSESPLWVNTIVTGPSSQPVLLTTPKTGDQQ